MTPLVLAQSALPGAATDLVPSVWRTGASLLVVLALLAVIAWMLRRFLATRKAGGAMSVETALALGERSRSSSLQWKARLLLGLAPGQVSVVASFAARHSNSGHPGCPAEHRSDDTLRIIIALPVLAHAIATAQANQMLRRSAVATQTSPARGVIASDAVEGVGTVSAPSDRPAPDASQLLRGAVMMTSFTHCDCVSFPQAGHRRPGNAVEPDGRGADAVSDRVRHGANGEQDQRRGHPARDRRPDRHDDRARSRHASASGFHAEADARGRPRALRPAVRIAASRDAANFRCAW